MHFTYEPKDSSDWNTLRQGDVLARTEQVEALLKLVHPHYLNQPDYKYLQVITQSCDLERRGGAQCNARYITIAAVRPLETAVLREVGRYQKEEVESRARIAPETHKSRIKEFVERLLQNNEKAYFYLHEEFELGLQQPCCTFLRLSIAVRSVEHYDTLVAAKVLQLRSEFQAKLGWQVGNLYSRVGTVDWKDSGMENRLKELTTRLTDEAVSWVPKGIYSKVVDGLKVDPPSANAERAAELVQAHRPTPKRDLAANRLREILPKSGLSPDEATKAISRVLSDPQFAAILKD